MSSPRTSPGRRGLTAAGTAVAVLGLAAGAWWWVPSAGADDASDASAPPTLARALDGYSVTASAAQVAVGETVTLSVQTSAAQDLYAYDLGVGFDPAVLDYVEGSASTALTGATYDTAGAGRVDVVHTELGSSPATSGAVTLVTLRFTALAQGEAGLVVDGLTTVDSSTSETRVAGAGVAPVRVVSRAAARAVSAPSVSGRARVGRLLTAGTGTWDAAGLSFTRQWLRGGAPIPGAVGATYRLTPADVGQVVTVQVTAAQADRVSGVARSAAGAPVDPARASLRVQVRRAEPGTRPKVVIRVGSRGVVVLGRVEIRYDGARVTDRRLREGRQVRLLPRRGVGDYRLRVRFEPASGFTGDREVRTVRVRR